MFDLLLLEKIKIVFVIEYLYFFIFLNIMLFLFSFNFLIYYMLNSKIVCNMMYLSVYFVGSYIFVFKWIEEYVVILIIILF